MAVRIRLQRQGKKGAPFYHIVVADGRAPRDGKFIERLGSYNPMTNPAQIDVNIDKAVQWIRNGAQPSDTVRSLLSAKGAMLKHHLLRGVDKGAITLEQAEAKFQAWVAEKENKVSQGIKERASKSSEAREQRLAEETKIKEAKAEAVLMKKNAAIASAVKEEEAKAEEAVAETEVSTDETPATEATAAVGEAAEAPRAEEPKEESTEA